MSNRGNKRGGKRGKRGRPTNSSGGGNSSSRAENADAKAQGQINRVYLCAFLDAFRLNEFEAKYDYKQFNMNQFLDWIVEIGGSANAPPPISELYSISMRKLESMRKRSENKVKSTEQAKNDTSDSTRVQTVRDVLDTQQVKQIARASLAVHSYSVQDERVYELFQHCFRETDVSPRFLIGTTYIPRVLGSRSSKTKTAIGDMLAVPSKIEAVLIFHCIRECMKKFGALRSPTAGTRLGFALQKIVGCWSRLISNTRGEDLGRLSSLIISYIAYNRNTGTFRVLKSKEEGFSNTILETRIEGAEVVNTVSRVSPAAWNRDEPRDAAVRYIVDMMFTHLQTLIGMEYLYAASDRDLPRWNELKKYALPTNVTAIPSVFSSLPDNVAENLGVVKPQVEASSDEDGAANVIDVDTAASSEQDRSTGPDPKRLKIKTKVGGEEDGGEEEGAETTVAKNEPINTTIRPGRSADISDEANAAYDTLNEAMVKLVAMYDCNFDDLLSTTVDGDGVDLEDNVDFLITDPPYNIRHDSSKENSEHDQFSREDMEDLVDLCASVMKKGAHGIIFCAFSQFEQYRKLFAEYTKTALDYEKDPTGNTSTEKSVFVVENVPLVFVKKNGNFNNPSKQSGAHVNVAEFCLHFWKTTGDSEEIKKSFRDRLDYDTPSEFGGTLPSWTNVVTNVTPPALDEIVYKPTVADDLHRSRQKMRPEQKPVDLIKFLLNKFTVGGDFVCDPCAGTFSVAKACLSMEKHRRFVGTDRDSVCVEVAEDPVLELYAKQLLDPQSDITTTSLDVRKAAQVLCNELTRIEVRRRADAWTTPSGLVPVQNFPPPPTSWSTYVSTTPTSLCTHIDTSL